MGRFRTFGGAFPLYFPHFDPWPIFSFLTPDFSCHHFPCPAVPVRFFSSLPLSPSVHHPSPPFDFPALHDAGPPHCPYPCPGFSPIGPDTATLHPFGLSSSFPCIGGSVWFSRLVPPSGYFVGPMGSIRRKPPALFITASPFHIHCASSCQRSSLFFHAPRFLQTTAQEAASYPLSFLPLFLSLLFSGIYIFLPFLFFPVSSPGPGLLMGAFSGFFFSACAASAISPSPSLLLPHLFLNTIPSKFDLHFMFDPPPLFRHDVRSPILFFSFCLFSRRATASKRIGPFPFFFLPRESRNSRHSFISFFDFPSVD